ncbi:undecaprenyl-diphosphate phosphatase [Muricomes intestini]|uniref:undecaprenyl-diphosphate phosphatase n=2 Tax=Muricomes intestini TaxID=1796634 RepID=UPI002FE0E602
MLEALKVIILGIVEGITEWLPISSTGHLILVEEFVKLKMSDDFMSMFNVVIQLGAILAVVVIYFHKLNPFSRTKTDKQKKLTLQLWVKVIVAAVPAAIIGLLFDDFLDEHLMNYVVVAIMLILYGVIFIVVEKRNEHVKPAVRRLSDLTVPMALLIGGFQVLALIPGTSRSGATIIGGLLIGASRAVAAEFTFFLAIPVMFGASLLKIIKFGFHFTGMEGFLLLLGCAVSFGVSIFAIRFLMQYIKGHDFKVFGYYRIVLGIIVLLYFGMSTLFA